MPAHNTLQENLSIGFKIIHYMKDILMIKRSNASQYATFKPHSLYGVSAQSDDPNGYLEYQRLLPKHFAINNEIRQQETLYHQTLQIKIPSSNIDYAANDLLIEIAYKLIGLSSTLAEKPLPIGGCTAFCNVVMGILLIKKIPFECFDAQSQVSADINHQFMVLGRDPRSNLRDIKTWGEHAVIIDAWDQFKCVSIKQIMKEPGQHPFFDVRYQALWQWNIKFAFPFAPFEKSTSVFKSFCQQELAELMVKHIPKAFDLPEKTTEPQNLLAICGMNDGPISGEILSIAMMKHQYDFYRLEFRRALYSDINTSYLEELSFAIGMGCIQKLIIITTELISINRLWFDYQLSPDKRREIMQTAQLPFVRSDNDHSPNLDEKVECLFSSTKPEL